MKQVLVALFVTSLTFSPVAAETMKQFLVTPRAATQLGYIGEGIAWANVYSDLEKKSPLYCPPDNLSITNEQYVSITETYLAKKNPSAFEYDSSTAPMLLMKALVFTFPCPK